MKLVIISNIHACTLLVLTITTSNAFYRCDASFSFSSVDHFHLKIDGKLKSLYRAALRGDKNIIIIIVLGEKKSFVSDD